MLEYLINHFPFLPQKLRSLLLKNIDKIYFLFVGGCAAAVHWTIATFCFLLKEGQWSTYLCNTLGFFCALIVSILGHSFLTFGKEFKANLASRENKTSYMLRTFLGQGLVGIFSFALNNLLLYLGGFLHLYFPILLFIVLLIVAVITFITSKYLVHAKKAN